MKFLPSAFGQLAFAWRLYHYGLEGKFDLNILKEELTFQDGNMIFVVPQAFHTPDELLLALENNLTTAFGAAAITLSRVREEIGVQLPDPIVTENDQCVSLIYQIRNAFAHDIAEPVWKIGKERYRRAYNFGGMSFDLTNLDGAAFRYEHLGGPERMLQIKEFFCRAYGIS